MMAALALPLAACSDKAPERPAPATTPSPTAQALPVICTPAGPTTIGGAKNINPYAAPGARQVPGPDMTDVPIPAEPVAVLMERPPDPDANVAARQPDGKPAGPVPSGPAPQLEDPACEQPATVGEAP